MMSEQVECYKCQVWLDDFQTKVIDGDDYCPECAFSKLDLENEGLQSQNATLLEALEYFVENVIIDGYDAGDEPLNTAWDKAREAIRKAK